MPDNGSIQKRDAHEMAHGRPVQITEHTTVTELQPSLSDVVCANKKLQIGFIVALVVLALLSGFVARPHFADTKTWDSTIEVIDQKKGNVLALTASCVALSAGITALPGDTGTPVAEQLAQLSGNLGIVLAVLYLEKYLLTILWSVGLGILIPSALVLFAVSLGIHGRWSTSAVLRRVATRVLVVAVIGMALVPASVWVSQKVDETYRVSIEQAEQKAADAADATDKSAETSSKSNKKKSEATESKNVLEQLTDGASSLVTSVTSGAKQMTDEIVQQVTDLIEGVIVMIVTSCVIPLLVLVAFLWLGHVLLGIDISGPANYLTGRFLSAPSRHAKKSGSLSRQQSDLWKINRKKGGRDTFSAALLFVERMVATSAPGPNGQQSSVNGICSKKNKDKQIVVAVTVRMCSNKHEQ